MIAATRDTQRELDDAWRTHGQAPEAASLAARQLLDLARALQHHELEAGVLVLQASIDIQRHGSANSRALLSEAASKLEATPSSPYVHRWRVVYAAYEMYRSEVGRALEEVFALLDQPVQAMDIATRGFAYAMAIGVLEDLRAFDLALAYGSKALTEVSAAEVPFARARILNNMAGSHFHRGDFESAAARCEQALAILTSHGIDNPHIRTTYADALMHMGDHVRARSEYARSQALFINAPSVVGEADVSLGLAELELREGNAQRAFRQVQEALLVHEASAKQRLVHTYKIAGEAAQAVGDFELALQYARKRANAYADLLEESGRGLIDAATRKLEISRLQAARSDDARRLADKDTELHLLRETQVLLAATADTDPLTAALNRRALFDRAQLLFERVDCKTTTVFVIDIDHFKTINDNYGHGVGDQVLLAVVQAIEQHLPFGALLGRYGGDEFVALMINGTTEDSMALAERWRRQVPVACAEVIDDAVTVTIGVCCGEELRFKSALERADQALLKAKRAGRDRVGLSQIIATGVA